MVLVRTYHPYLLETPGLVILGPEHFRKGVVLSLERFSGPIEIKNETSQGGGGGRVKEKKTVSLERSACARKWKRTSG